MTERYEQLRARFDEWEIDGLLVTGATNRRWLSGFTGSAGMLLITREHLILSTDFRYWQQARTQAPAYALFEHRNRPEDTEALIRSVGFARLGLESQHTAVAEYKKLQQLEGIEWKTIDLAVEPLREVKSAEELEKIQAAARIADAVMEQVPMLARPGMSEAQLAWELEKRIRESGADKIAFEVIVASGPNSALPHHRPGRRLLRAGDSIIVDLGAEIDGYKSDLTRTFFLGLEPDAKFLEIYQLVRAAQQNALEGMRAGMTGKEADALARDIIASAGHADHFGHGLGHGVGLDVHDWPRLSYLNEKGRLSAGNVLTVEPGVYIPDWGGVRLEDLVYLTADGPHRLSHCPMLPAIPS